jgi:hypothetical protein
MRKSEVLLAISLVGSIAVSMWLWGELRTERTRNAELSARLDSLPEGVPAPQAAAAPEPISTVTSPAAPTPADPATAPAADVAQRTDEDPGAYQRRMLKQPKYREAWRAQLRLNYALRRENVIRLLGFTPEQADAVIELAIDDTLRWIERTRPDPITDEYRQQEAAWIEQDKREDQDKLRGLLGEQKLAQFQEYMESRATRTQVDQLRPLFTGADAIRDDQVEPLIAALHVERAGMQRELNEYRETVDWTDPQASQQAGEHQVELLKATYNRMHSAAAPVLSGSQLNRLDALLKRDLERQEAEMRMRRIRMKAN